MHSQQNIKPSETLISVYKCPRIHIPEDMMAIEMFS